MSLQLYTGGNPDCGADANSSAVHDKLRGVQQVQAAEQASAAISKVAPRWKRWRRQLCSPRSTEQVQSTRHAFAATLEEGSLVMWGRKPTSWRGQFCGPRSAAQCAASSGLRCYVGLTMCSDSSAVQDQLRKVKEIPGHNAILLRP